MENSAMLAAVGLLTAGRYELYVCVCTWMFAYGERVLTAATGGDDNQDISQPRRYIQVYICRRYIHVELVPEIMSCMRIFGSPH